MLGSRREIARMQGDFYRDKYRNTLRRLLFSLCVTVALICVIIYLVLTRVSPGHFASTSEGQIIPLAAVDVT